jgi:hypothetical protein
MKKLLYAGVLTLALTALAIAGKSNVIWHWDAKSGSFDIISSSGGNCRHHLEAHPQDHLATVHGDSTNPDDCN